MKKAILATTSLPILFADLNSEVEDYHIGMGEYLAFQVASDHHDPILGDDAVSRNKHNPRHPRNNNRASIGGYYKSKQGK